MSIAINPDRSVDFMQNKGLLREFFRTCAEVRVYKFRCLQKIYAGKACCYDNESYLLKTALRF